MVIVLKKIFTILGFIIISLFLTTGCDNKYMMTPEENLSYAKLRLAAATSAVVSYDGNLNLGTITKEDFNVLGKMVKNYDSSANWFSEEYMYYAKIADLENKEVTYLCDDDYCAKFVVEKDDKTYLTEYSFQESEKKGNRIIIDDFYSTDTSHDHDQEEVEAVNETGLVYWAPSSTFYHADKDCPAFSRSESVYEGTVAQAKTKGVKKPCRRCIPEIE